ncbi:MAG: hypothetical protein IJJ82_01490 [Clostridia bacterium]|nr:hypothetical protein [Clostridia bacterium]
MERVDSNYRKAFVEVDAVLNCLNTNAYNKIPLNVINAIRDNKDENYQYEYDEKIEYYKWNFMNETKAILYNLFKKYLATEEQIKYFIEKERKELYKIEEEKRERYNAEDLFKNKNIQNNVAENVNSQNVEMIARKESLIKKIWKKIKAIFKK